MEKNTLPKSELNPLEVSMGVIACSLFFLSSSLNNQFLTFSTETESISKGNQLELTPIYLFCGE